jgi:hypothetical protein
MTTPSINILINNTRLIDIIVDVDSKKIIIGNFVAYNKKDTATEAEIILLTEAVIVSNSDNVRLRSIIFMASLDIG